MAIRLMVVEDEILVREGYRALIREHPALQLAAETESPKEAMSILKTMSIDAMILELELRKGSGVLLLREMQQLHGELPFIVVVTNVVSKSVYTTVRKLGADYICAKGDVDFSLDVPLSIIEISAQYQKRSNSAKNISGEVIEKTKQDIYKRVIKDELMQMGFPSKMVGTVQCQEALLYIVMSGHLNVSLTKEVYPHVAKEYSTNSINVERNIRVVIEKVWTKQNGDMLKSQYSQEWNQGTGRPTNAEFLFNMAKKICRY